MKVNNILLRLVLSKAYSIVPWFEEVRPIEIITVFNHFRGITLIKMIN
jgi:hypothetical protein